MEEAGNTKGDYGSDRVEHGGLLHVDKANIGYYNYSSVIYLTTCQGDTAGDGDGDGDFSGGEFTFCDPSGDEVVEPRAGRCIIFPSGCLHVHAVKPVTAGMRMAIACWFTLTEQARHSTTRDDRHLAKFRLVSGLGRDLSLSDEEDYC